MGNICQIMWNKTIWQWTKIAMSIRWWTFGMANSCNFYRAYSRAPGNGDGGAGNINLSNINSNNNNINDARWKKDGESGMNILIMTVGVPHGARRNVNNNLQKIVKCIIFILSSASYFFWQWINMENQLTKQLQD